MNTQNEHPCQQEPVAIHSRAPITCPRCGKREIAFVTEYHQSIACRIVCAILTGIIIGFLFSVFETTSSGFQINRDKVAIVVLLLFVLVIIKIVQYFIESQTHVQAICRDCGCLWLLN